MKKADWDYKIDDNVSTGERMIHEAYKTRMVQIPTNANGDIDDTPANRKAVEEAINIRDSALGKAPAHTNQ